MAENIVLPKRVKDLTGQKFGRLLVTRYAGGVKQGYVMTVWECLCDCGTTKIIRANALLSGNTNTCGCSHHVSRPKHGMLGTRVYRSWAGMKTRCLNPKSTEWEIYGGRGIKVCERWHQFENFLEDMGEPPTSKHSIDRIDSNGDYTPENCRWATSKEQGRNTSRNVFVTYNEETKCISEWAEEIGMKPSTLCYRIAQGWSAHDALTRPLLPGVKHG